MFFAVMTCVIPQSADIACKHLEEISGNQFGKENRKCRLIQFEDWCKMVNWSSLRKRLASSASMSAYLLDPFIRNTNCIDNTS